MPQEVYDKFIDLSGSKDKIVVIPSGMENPYSLSSRWDGCTILHPKTPDEVFDPKFSAPISKATGLWILGGDQMKLAKLYNNTPVEDEIRSLILRGGVVGGTSAGATIFSEIMVYDETEAEGLGLLRFIIDQHFSERDRLPRLQKLINKYPGRCGIGIDESTALIMSNQMIEVVGLGKIFFCKDNSVIYKTAGQFSFSER